MPLMTQTTRHGEMSIPMTDPNPPLYGGVENRLRCRQGNTHPSIATSGRPPLSSTRAGRTEDKCFVSPPELEPNVPTFSSASTVSRFMDRLGASAPSLSSLRTIPSWRSSVFPNTNKTYAQIHSRSSSESDTPNSPSSHGARPHQPSLTSLQRQSLRHRRQDKHSTSQNCSHDSAGASVHVSKLLERFAFPTKRTHDNPSSSSLSTGPSSSLDDYAPYPSTSEESYPSPYSADARAVFHFPTDRRGTSSSKGRRKHENTLENRIQVIFEEATDTTSTSATASSVHPPAKRRSRIGRLKRRMKALASMLPSRSKAPIVSNKESRSPHPDDCDDVDYDIPCLAYISCIW